MEEIIKKTIDIVVPTFNEEENVGPLYQKVFQMAEEYPKYNFTLTFIDNKSTDQTRKEIEKLAAGDKRVRAIYNARNFGHIRSPFYALSHSDGDCAVLMAADFQDPPEKLKEFIQKWEEGFKVIYAVKKESFENKFVYFLRTFYYRLMKSISDIPQIEHFTGFGLYDKDFLKILKDLNDPYPYMRGLVAELGFATTEIEFKQPKRKKGKTKNTFYTLYDMAALGITTYSKKLMRYAVFLSLFTGIVSFLGLIAAIISDICGMPVTALHYLSLGLFLFLSLIMFYIGLLSEYVMIVNQRTLKRPLVIEEKRINFKTDENLKIE
jgi:glycosyltransferase involved in cell wall biosynthesis